MRNILPVVALFVLCAAPAWAQPIPQDPNPTRPAELAPRAPSGPEDPEELYNRGLRQMKRGYYDEAIINFERVRNHFPFNQYSVLSELRVADCMYEKSSYLEAVDAYRQFARLHPRHADIDYVVYRTARSEFKLAPTIAQRDQTHARRGLRRLEDFEEKFPKSKYTAEVLRLREKTEMRLSRAGMQIGAFYFSGKHWKASERRYRLAIQEYPNSPLVARAQFRRGLCMVRLATEVEDASEATALRDEAAVVFGTVLTNYADSRFADRARRELERLGEAEPAEPAPAPEAPAKAGSAN